MSRSHAKRGPLTPEAQAERDDRLISRLVAPQVGRRLSTLGQSWRHDIAGATASAVGITVDELRELEAGRRAEAIVVLPAVVRPVGEFDEIAAAVIIDSAVVRAAVADELAKVDKWTRLANLPEIVAELRKVDEAAADKLAACSNPECGYVKFCPTGDYSQYCNRRCWLRICPNCAKAIAARLRDKLAAVLVEVVKANVGGWSLKHLVPTLRRTLANVDGMGAEEALFARSICAKSDLEELHDMDKALFKLVWGDDGRAGCMGNIEFGPEGGNVHAHNILYGRYVQQSTISDKWRELSLKRRRMWRPWVAGQWAELEARKASYSAELKVCGKSRSTRARRLRLLVRSLTKRRLWSMICRRAQRAGVGDYIVHISQISEDAAVAEVVKYVTKLHKTDDQTGRFETSTADLIALHLALKGKRRSWSWGSFYNADVVDDEPAEVEPGCCPKCGASLLGMPVADVRPILDLKHAIKYPAGSHPGHCSAAGPPGGGP